MISLLFYFEIGGRVTTELCAHGAQFVRIFDSETSMMFSA